MLRAVVLVPLALSLTALTFFIAERSLSLFTWSRLEELELPRSRRQAVERCLRERGMVITSFVIVGCMAAAALGILLALRLETAHPEYAGQWYAWAEIGLILLTLIWAIPELTVWRLSDEIVIYLAPLLSRVVTRPFRALRLLMAAPAADDGEPARPAADTARGLTAEDSAARELFRTAVRLPHIQVREIMTPRTEIVTVPETATLRYAAQVSLESGLSRIPVFRGNRDHVVGVLHAKDLLRFAATEKWDQAALSELMRQPFFVPETKPASELLEELQRSNIHMGIVLDEYGGTSGLVTLEDVVEELIGEIHDEHEAGREESPPLKWLDAHTAEVQAVMRIVEFNEALQLDVPEVDDFDTVGGFVTFSLGKIPAKGESFAYGPARITILDADARHVIRVRVELGRAAGRGGGE